VLVTAPVTSSAVEYYFRGQVAGRWSGQGAHRLGLAGPVDRQSLTALLRGCHPDNGQFLPARRPARRRAGWDLTLAAPKSVSLLAAVAARDRDEVAAAHMDAVDEVVAHFERRLLAVRRATAPGGLVGATGLIAACFDHRVNAAGEPHVHSHLIVCNLGEDRDGRWSAIDSGWWTARASVAAIYQMGLRHHLGQGGLHLEWRVREDGFAEIIGVPRAAVRAASSRRRAAVAAQAAYGADVVGRLVGIRSAATGQSRRSGLTGPGTPGVPIDDARHILQAARNAGDQRPPGPGEVPGLEDAVTARLAASRSSFRTPDVFVALAACTPQGLGGAAAEGWVDRFCAAAHPEARQAGQAPRWTTPAAEAADARLWACAQRLANRRPQRGDGELRITAGHDVAGLAQRARAAARELAANGRSLHVLAAPAGRTNLLAQAAVLEAANTVWQARGQLVAVAASSDLAAQRWRVLTGLGRYRPGAGAQVVVVDHADRRPTPDLLALLLDIDRAGARAVLVEGGTAPRLSWRRSAALTSIGDRFGRLDPGPEPDWVNPVGPSGPPTTAQAVRRLLSSWLEARTTQHPAVLVGLGYAETDRLNLAARAILVARGQIDGPALVSRGRVFQAGDEALSLRRLAPGLPPGTFVSVAKIDARRRLATVTWGGSTATLDQAALAHAGYGYAVTPPLAARASGPLMVLGPADSMGPHRARVAVAARGAAVPDRGIRMGLG
jgi:conjugative relaxase-like TrwC/TraI family protein